MSSVRVVTLRFTGLPASCATGAQIDLRLELERLVGHVSQAVVARHLVQVHLHLVEREGLPYAMAWTCREGHVGEARPLRLVLGRETLRVEALRVFPEARMTVQQV